MRLTHLRPFVLPAWCRTLLGLGAVCLAAGLGACAAPASPRATAAAAAPAATPPSTVRMTLTPVAEGTWFVQGQSALGSAANQNFISNAAFVVADGGVLVIDSLGSPPLAQQLLAKIREVTPLPVRYVVVTHCHADHIYGLQVFKAAGATIVGHAGCRDYLNSDTARLRLQASREELFPWVDENTRLVWPDLWLGEGGSEADLVLHIGQRSFRVHHVGPSHTAEDVVVYDATTGVLFAGDVVFRGRIPFVGQADSRRWIGALDRMLELRPKVLVPGHGPLSHDPVGDLKLTRDYLVYLRQTMGDAARNLEPFEDAYKRADWSRFDHLPLFAAANRMNAYNTYLLMEHEAP
jgi:glyoxylase-like metal-dependent hydrolase (beta-lactamase superfamily II)